MKPFRLKRIIWAIDPFDREINSGEALRTTFQQLVALDNIEIQPTYISRGERLFQPLEQEARAVLERLTAEYQLPGMLQPRVLRANTAKVIDAVDKLMSEAKDTKSDLIITQTHGRHGMRRLFLGSFAETLLLRSSIPVLIMNPFIVPSQKFQRILFPTDFDHHAVTLFKQVVGFAKFLGSRIILFHVIPTPILPYSRGTEWLLSRQYESLIEEISRKQREKAERRVNAWTTFASGQGVPTEFVLETDGDSLWELTLRAAKRHKVKLIALETERGPKEAAVFGSTTRNLVRYSDCPVLVLRSHYSSLVSTRIPRGERAA